MTNRKRTSIRDLLILIAGLGIFSILFGTSFFFGFGNMLLILLAVLLLIVGCYGSIFLFRRLFQKIYPANEADTIESDYLDTKTFHLYKLYSELTFPLGWAICGFLSYQLMIWQSNLWFQHLPGQYIVPMEEIYWSIPAFFAGGLYGYLISSLMLRIILRQRIKSYWKHFEISWEFDTKKFFRLMIFLCILLIGVFIYIGLATYTRFTEDGIYFHRAYQVEEEFYPYTQVEKIEEQIRTQKSASSHTFLIQFSDGRQWKPMTVNGGAIPESYPLIMELVSRKSGRPVYQVETGNQ